MAALYGRLTGNGAEVTRTGTIASGIRSQVQTHTAGVRVQLEHDGRATVAVVNVDTGECVVVWDGDTHETMPRRGND